MNSKNMHYCYNVEYFQDTLTLPQKGGEAAGRYTEHNQYIYNFASWDDSYRRLLMEEESLRESLKSFSLSTVYPGLLIGSGYSHAIKNEKNAIIGGFYFDYVTGLPVIPGSTVKGMLRSYFQEGEKWAMIRELIGTSDVKLKEMKENLFEENDIYIGGFPITGKNTKLLDSEYITPHKEQFKDPIPLSLLKIRPGIRFEFVFLLHDYVDNEKMILTADEKKNLFQNLLMIGGIGAKTNVGFGQFCEVGR